MVVDVSEREALGLTLAENSMREDYQPDGHRAARRVFKERFWLHAGRNSRALGQKQELGLQSFESISRFVFREQAGRKKSTSLLRSRLLTGRPHGFNPRSEHDAWKSFGAKTPVIGSSKADPHRCLKQRKAERTDPYSSAIQGRIPSPPLASDRTSERHSASYLARR